MGNPAPGFSAVRERPSGQDDLILDENRLNGAAFSGLTAGIFEIIGNVVFNLGDSHVALHLEDFGTDINTSFTSDAQFFIHPYSHDSPFDGV
jgi:hypothetical protein